MTEQKLLDAVQAMHADPRAWCMFRGLKTGTGFGNGCQQELDAWAISCWSSAGEKSRITYEVKLSRSDYFRELKDPPKRKLGLMLSNFFYFVTPAGLVKPEELPPECGLIEVTDGKAKKTVIAPRRDSYPPPWTFLASICRRVQSAENGSGVSHRS